MPRIYDVSVPVRTGGVVYPGNPEISIEPHQSISKGAGANVSRVSFGSHTGTHVDAPRHFFDHAESVDELSLDTLTGRALLISVDESLKSVTARDLEKHELGDHTRILIRTRNSSFPRDAGFDPSYTFLAPDGAVYLVEQGVRLVGVDYFSVEQFHSGHHLTHRTLFESGVVIVEGLALSEPAPGEYDLYCLPLRLEGLDGAPARAILIQA